jgi:hypothetical protein
MSAMIQAIPLNIIKNRTPRGLQRNSPRALLGEVDWAQYDRFLHRVISRSGGSEVPGFLGGEEPVATRNP